MRSSPESYLGGFPAHPHRNIRLQLDEWSEWQAQTEGHETMTMKREIGPFIIEYKDGPRSHWRRAERVPFYSTRVEAQTTANKLQTHQNDYVPCGCELRVREISYQIKTFT